jgi:alginate O-acetyltransferase complex protein AlgI
MIFNSLEFLIFLPIVLIVYYRLTHKQQNIWLLIASYIFYGWWDPRFLFLISISTTIDFYCAKLLIHNQISRADKNKGLAYLSLSCAVFLGIFNVNTESNLFLLGCGFVVVALIAFSFLFESRLALIDKTKKKRIVLMVSIFTNLGLLAFFKYFNFFVDSAETILMSMGISERSLIHLDIILPVGISFYTFQTMSYTIDVYRGKLQPCNSFIDFALFVSFFPQLVAGPIERATNLLPRILEHRKFSSEHFYSGIGLICYGLFKKVVIADGVAASVASIYGTSGDISWLDIVAATLLFTIQIYCDFSGYTDIARGTSRLLGIELMRNFNFPYFSRNPSEFWRRWHISLSSWLRDYLYISLGGNRASELKIYRNLMITMVLGGLWHGAAWNYVLWGVYQGSLLCFYRRFIPDSIFSANNRITNSIKVTAGIGVFFMFTMYGWLLFRAESFSQIVQFTGMLVSDFGNLTLNMPKPPFATLAALPLLVFFEFRGYFSDKEIKLVGLTGYLPRSVMTMGKSFLIGFMIFIFMGALSTPPAEFIYFQF